MKLQKPLLIGLAACLLGAPLTVRLTAANGINWKVQMWSGRTDLKTAPVPDVPTSAPPMDAK